MKKQNWRVKNLPASSKWDKNGRWKGGVIIRTDGYILVNLGSKSKKSKGARYKLMHRIVMENFLGRPLLRSEIVHHIDGNKSNNNIINLKIMTQKEHAKEDYEKRQKNKLGQLVAKKTGNSTK